MKKATIIAAMALMMVSGLSAQALMVNSDNRIFTGPNEVVTATFVSSSASHDDQVYLNMPTLKFIFDNHATASGTKVGLGTFAANSELLFELQDVTTGKSYFNNTALNEDGFDHVKITDLGNNTWQLAWEDLISGGDQDFNDLIFTIHGDVVPEPGVLILVGMGLTGLAGIARRRRMRQAA